MRTANPSTALFLLLAAALPAGEGPDSPVWDKVIARQPFDRAPFRRVRVPEWVKDTVGAGYTLSGMGSEDRRKAAAAGVTLSELGFVDPFYAYYESKLLSRRSPHVPMGRLEKDIAEYKRLGIRILGVYPPCLQGEVYEKHPDWRRVAADTSEVPQVDLVKYPHGGMLCLLGPYGDFFIEVLAEILTLYPDVDAFSFDGLHHGGFCYCRHCREDYRKDTGLEIPRVDLEDPAFRRYQHWADRRLESLIQRMQTRLKGLKPEVALVTWTTNAGRFGHLRDIPRNMPARMNLLLDAPDQELWLDETNRGATVLPSFASAYIYALTDHRVAFSEPYLMSHGNPYGKDSFPAHEVERRMMLVLTHGACPSIAVSQPGDLQAAVVHGLAEVGRRKRWLVRKEPEPWAAILMSDDTRNFYGRSPGRVEERYVSHVLGAFRAALEEHLPAALVCDWNLNSEDLAKYRVLVLPDAACLDDEQVEAVRGFVEKGGGLVASLDTSLFDASGNPREDFALGRVLGVRYRGLPDSKAAGEIDVNFARGLGPDYWEKRKGVFELKLKEGSPLDSPRLTEYLGGAPVTFKGPAVKVRVEPVPRAAPAPGTAGGGGTAHAASSTAAPGRARRGIAAC